MRIPIYRATHDTVTPVNSRECFPGLPAMTTQRRSASMKTRRILATATLGLFLGFPGLAKAQYRFTTYDVPGSTGTSVNANSQHAIAGQFDDRGGNTHGFVLSRGVYAQVDVAGASFTSVNGINASGEISGIYIDAGGTYHGYFQSKGVLTTLDPPGSTHTQAEFVSARRGRGSLPRCEPDASRFHLEQGCLHDVRRARLGGPARDRGLRDQRPWTGRGHLRGRRWQPPRLLAEQGDLHNARRS